MGQIERSTLMSLEQYARERPAFRAGVLHHKKERTVAVGPSITLMFEDELTIRYQIQEMLRVEKTFEETGIRDELDAYNPLIPDGSNWKATMLIEFPEAEERKRRLASMRDVEHQVWMQAEGCARVMAIADEDMERSNAEKTSAVHFLRFELPTDVRAALKSGAEFELGIDHPAYSTNVAVSEPTRVALVRDLAG